MLHVLVSSYASSDLFVLLSWSCGIYTIGTKSNSEFHTTHTWRVLVGTMAILLDMLNGSTAAKSSLKQGTLVRVRRALRSVCIWKIPRLLVLTSGQADDRISDAISTLLALSKSSQTPFRLLPLLGVAVSVLIRLRNVDTEPSARLSLDLKVMLIISLLFISCPPLSER